MNDKWKTLKSVDWDKTEHVRYVLVVGCYVISFTLDGSSQNELYADLVLKTSSEARVTRRELMARKRFSGGDVEWILGIDNLKDIAEKWLFDHVNMDYVSAKVALKLLRPDQEIGEWGIVDDETYQNPSESRKKS